MKFVRPKKHLGQHFLNDQYIAENIVNSLQDISTYHQVLEVGPGTGVLTQFLQKKNIKLKVVEIDKESVDFLKENFNFEPDQIIEGDFLRMNLDTVFDGPFGLIGNFPYNISSQIFFKVLENKNKIPEVKNKLI